MRLIVLSGRSTRSTRSDLIVLKFLLAAPVRPLQRECAWRREKPQLDYKRVLTRMRSQQARKRRRRHRAHSKSRDNTSRDEE